MALQQATENTLEHTVHTLYEQCVGIFSDFLPRPDASSANLRVFEIVSSLLEAGYTVRYYWWLPTEDDDRYLEQFSDSVDFHFIERDHDVIAEAAFEHRLDQVWFTNLWGTDWIASAYEAAKMIREQAPAIPIIADTMDYHAKKYYRKYDRSGAPADLALADTFFEVERQLYSVVDGIVTVTDSEARDIAGAFNLDTPAHVVSNIHRPTPSAIPFDDRNDFVFLGNFRVPHNVDAVTWFLDEVHPHLSPLLPDARLHLIGKHADELPEAIAGHPAVKVVGYVKELPPHLSQFRAMVAPLTYGSGMKGKIGSATACGLPVIATDIGAEGYPFDNGVHAFIANDPAEFAEHCARLHTDKATWETMSARMQDEAARSLSSQEPIGNLLRMTGGFADQQPAAPEPFTGVYSCRSLPEFVRVMGGTDRRDRIVIIEPTLSHQETFHSLIEYCQANDFGVDFLLRSEFRDSRDILETLSDVPGLDAAFFYVMNPDTVGDCVSALNSANHHATFFNTLFEYWLQDGLMDSPHWERLSASNLNAYVHHRTKFSQTAVRHPAIPDANLFTLSERESHHYGTPLLCPSFFYNASPMEPGESAKTRFVCVGGVGDERRDYSQLIDACILLNDAGFSDAYQVDIIGADYTPNGDWAQKYGTNIRRYGLESNIRLLGERPFKELFSYVAKSDYLLFLINMSNPYSREYLGDKITGSLNLSLGFETVPVLDGQLAESWGLEQSAVTYDGYHGFLKSIMDIMQGNISRQPLQLGLRAKNAQLKAVSIDNIKTRLCQD